LKIYNYVLKNKIISLIFLAVVVSIVLIGCVTAGKSADESADIPAVNKNGSS